VPLYEIVDTKLTPEELTAGDDDVRLTLTIKNVGEEEGESVRMKVFGKTEQPINFDVTSDFIAPYLEPGEEGQGTVIFDIDDDASLQKYFLDLEIKNIVNEDVITYDKKIEIEVTYPKPNNPWKFVGVGIVLVVIVLIVIIGKALKKSKKKSKAKKVKGKYGDSYLDNLGEDKDVK